MTARSARIILWLELKEVFRLVTPLELSLVLSTLALVFLVAAGNNGELM
ncbi:hypothetical protein [Methylocystis bryophila]|nr:hypothetical protein [Methylocystis bryophila]